MRIQFPVSANVKICINRCVVLNSCLRKTATRLEGYVSFPHISSIIRFSEHSSFVPSCSYDVPHSFPYLLLPTFFYFGLPFLRENIDQLLIFNYLFAERKTI